MAERAALATRPTRVLVASPDHEASDAIHRTLVRHELDVDVISELSRLVFAYDDASYGGRRYPDVVVLDDRISPVGTLFVLIDRIMEHSAVVLCVDANDPVLPEYAVTLGMAAVLRRPVDAATLAAVVRNRGTFLAAARFPSTLPTAARASTQASTLPAVPPSAEETFDEEEDPPTERVPVVPGAA
jgi:AmiR/NasT family two-component response regulator